jgi:hypothetical protein
MTPQQIGFIVSCSRKAGMSAKACQEAGACFSLFQTIASGEAEQP